MDKGYDYWDNRYTVGEINFIKDSKNNFQRDAFVNWVKDAKDIKSILEVGPGEMIEYQKIRKLRPDIKYSISDVSGIFIENCKRKYPQVDTYNFGLEELDQIEKTFDCVYVSSVFEHSSNVRKAIQNCIGLGKYFHFVFFKWMWAGRELMPTYNKRKNLYSTRYNIWAVLDEIKKYGKIEYTEVIDKHEIKYSLQNYHKFKLEYARKKGKTVVKQRDGNWLAIHGRRK